MNQKLILLNVFFLLILSKIILAQGFKDEKRLIVTGEVEVMVPADNAKFKFEISGKGSTLNEAVIISKDKVKLISNSLFEIGLQKENLRTSFFDSRENFGDKSFWSLQDDFKAQMVVLISIDSLELLESVILKVSEFKPDKISNIQFSLKNYENVKIDALEAAVKKAKEKAEILSKNMNTKLGNVMYIEEILNTISPLRNTQSYLANVMVIRKVAESYLEAGNSFFTQQLKVRVKVRVIIELAESQLN